MNRSAALACVVAFAWSMPAAAQVHEPNGLAIPITTPNGETSLRTYFMGQGEPIDWVADAHTTPATFSPLCGFTATFVLNQAGSHFGLAWYNATGSRPAASDLHSLLPAGAAVGTMFSGTDIRSNPAYTGGEIGFALIGGETHYSESQWDTVCTSCSTPGPWITALVYQSVLTPNAYYLGFEDGGTSASGWNNDGDFNDDVFFITGVTCTGGGAACDTGMLGVCAQGAQQCTDGGTLQCVPLVTSSPETCNAVDDDCNGTTDDGTGLCAADFVCDQGTCVHACNGSEFPCASGLTCNAMGYCVDPLCATVMCAAGSVCHAGTCRAPCDGVVCPHGQVCRVDRCVDPCTGVTCPSGQACDAGVCREACTCLPCSGGLACDSASGRCLEAGCETMTCGTGTHCEAGGCVDDCAGATCPPSQLCMAGACVPDPCATVTCTSAEICRDGACHDRCEGVTCTGGQVCVLGTCMTDPCAGVTCPTGTHCASGTCASDGADSGTHTDAGATADSGVHGGRPPTSGGCCSVNGASPIGRGAGAAMLLLVAMLARRRRR